MVEISATNSSLFCSRKNEGNWQKISKTHRLRRVSMGFKNSPPSDYIKASIATPVPSYRISSQKGNLPMKRKEPKTPQFTKKQRTGAERLANLLAVNCVRNTFLEKLHIGTYPSSKTGDFSDIKVITPFGEIPWNEHS